jgi:hypothetical protein
VKRVLIVCCLGFVGSLVTLAACKQGQGDRCQVDDDCESGLVCNKAKNTCQSDEGGNIDAGIIDAAADAPDAM